MSAIQKRIQELAFAAIAKIGQIASSSKGKDAALALSVIERITRAVKDAVSKKIRPDDLARLIERESKSLAEQLAQNANTIRDEIDSAFPK